MDYAREEFNLLLGERTAEDIKISIGSAAPLSERLEAVMRGRDMITGLPKAIVVNDDHIRTALARSVTSIVDAVRQTIEEAPPELVADFMEKGITLAGGGALLRNLDKVLEEAVRIPVHIASDPLTCVVRGTGLVLEDLDALRPVLVSSRYDTTPFK